MLLTTSQEATIVYDVGGITEPPFAWKDSGNRHPVLSAIGIFDSSCAFNSHQRKKSSRRTSIQPGHPDSLADVCKRLEKIFLRRTKRSLSKASYVFSNRLGSKTTLIGKAISA
jgi:hypothetical protein